MTNPELERERGEFEKCLEDAERRAFRNPRREWFESLLREYRARLRKAASDIGREWNEEFSDGMLMVIAEAYAENSSQQSTLRRVRGLAQGFLGELTPEQFPPHGLVPAGRRWDNGKSEQFVKYMLAAIEREFGGAE